MKKLAIYLLSVFSILSLFSRCTGYDDTEIKDSITSLEWRVEVLEDICKDLNSDIDAMQSVIGAYQGEDFITGVTPVYEDGEEIGYTIKFSESDPITIYNGTDGTDGADGTDGKDGADGQDGADGVSPIIGVKEDVDGELYWVVDLGNGDFEWLLDEQGEKVSASVAKGYKPVIGVKSYNGVSYWTIDDEFIFDASGNLVPTTGGSTGSSLFSGIEYFDTYIQLTLYSGLNIQLPIYGNLITLSGYNGEVIEYTLNQALTLSFECDLSQCSSVVARVTNDMYSSVDVCTRTAATDVSWGVTIDENAKTLTLVAPQNAAAGDNAFLELIAISKSGLTTTVLATIELVDETKDIEEVIPIDILDDLDGHMPIYSGINPPTVEGIYIMDDPTVVFCEDAGNGGYDVGYTGFVDMYIRFYDQDNVKLTLKIEEQQGTSEATGSGAFIRGEGNNFTAYFDTDGTSIGDEGNTIKTTTALVVSGTKTSSGIQNIRYAFIMVDKQNDTGSDLMEEGVYRVFRDNDELASKVSSMPAPQQSSETRSTTYGLEMWSINSQIK